MQMLRYAPGCRIVGEARSSAQIWHRRRRKWIGANAQNNIRKRASHGQGQRLAWVGIILEISDLHGCAAGLWSRGPRSAAHTNLGSSTDFFILKASAPPPKTLILQHPFPTAYTHEYTNTPPSRYAAAAENFQSRRHHTSSRQTPPPSCQTAAPLSLPFPSPRGSRGIPSSQKQQQNHA